MVVTGLFEYHLGQYRSLLEAYYLGEVLCYVIAIPLLSFLIAYIETKVWHKDEEASMLDVAKHALGYCVAMFVASFTFRFMVYASTVTDDNSVDIDVPDSFYFKKNPFKAEVEKTDDVILRHPVPADSTKTDFFFRYCGPQFILVTLWGIAQGFLHHTLLCSKAAKAKLAKAKTKPGASNRGGHRKGERRDIEKRNHAIAKHAG